MLSSALSLISPTTLKVVALMNFAAQQLYVRAEASMDELCGVSLIPRTGNLQVTLNIMQWSAGEQRLSIKLLMRRLILRWLRKLLGT